MKIAFAGASGTGKTTLAKYLSEKLDLPFNPVGARSVAKKMGFDNPYDVDRASVEAYNNYIYDIAQEDSPEALRRAAEFAMSKWAWADKHESPTVRTMFQRRLQREKIEWEQGRESFVTDRSTADDFAYSALHHLEGITTEYMDQAQQHLRTYDIILFTPIDSFFNLAGDPNRVEEQTYHWVYEMLLKGILTSMLGPRYDRKVFTVGDGSLGERERYVFYAVNRLAEAGRFFV